MSDAFILKNQHDQFLDKHGEWIDQADVSALYRTAHKDEAINRMVEYTVKNPDARVRIVDCMLNEKRQLTLKPEDAMPAAVPTSKEPAGDIEQAGDFQSTEASSSVLVD